MKLLNLLLQLKNNLDALNAKISLIECQYKKAAQKVSELSRLPNG